MAKFIEAVKRAEVISEKFNIPLADLVDVFAEIPTANNEDCTRTPKERGADKMKITCLNCKHLMFSDMCGECNKQLKIVNPSYTCEYAEPKERGGWQ